MNYINIRKEINENIKHTVERSFKLFKEFYLTSLKLLIGMFLEKCLTLHENIIAENLIKIIINNKNFINLYFSKDILLISGTFLFLLLFFHLFARTKEEQTDTIKDVWLHSTIICCLFFLWHAI